VHLNNLNAPVLNVLINTILPDLHLVGLLYIVYWSMKLIISGFHFTVYWVLLGDEVPTY